MPKKRVGSLFKKTPDAAKWTGAWIDPSTGKRKTKVLFSDKAASRRRLEQLVFEADQRAAGITCPIDDQLRRPIQDHLDEYLAHCEHIRESETHVKNKRSQVERMLAAKKITHLSQLDPNVVEQYLQELSKSGRRARLETESDPGLSARSVNQHRNSMVAFVQWCARTGRMRENPLTIVPKLDERKDRRRIRRAFEDDELARLLGSVPEYRRLVYLTAVRTGLRRSELAQIRWTDIDFELNSIKIRIGVGKAAREDLIPIHPQLIDELAAARDSAAQDTDCIFAKIPNIRTFGRDLDRAQIQTADSRGWVVDFHALRKTFGTDLAKAGVTPQVARKLMRHSDMKTTLEFYTDLRLHDQAGALGELPWVGSDPISVPGDNPAEDGSESLASAPLAIADALKKEAQKEAIGAPEDAFRVISLHDRQDGESIKFEDCSAGHRAQVRYTSPLGTSQHGCAESADGHSQIRPKAEKTRAIGAVG